MSWINKNYTWLISLFVGILAGIVITIIMRERIIWICSLNPAYLQIYLTIIGFLIALLFIYYQHRLLQERDNTIQSRQSQEWFDKTFIRDGVEPLMFYLCQLEQHNPFECTIGLKEGNQIYKGPPIEFPAAALIRIEHILGNSAIVVLFGLIHALASETFMAKNERHRKELQENINILLNQLDTLLRDIMRAFLKLPITSRQKIDTLYSNPMIVGFTNCCVFLLKKMEKDFGIILASCNKTLKSNSLFFEGHQ